MIRKSKGNRQFTMFGIMAVLLGSGDAFHLVPRALALCTTGLENFTVQLGLGKWITSVTQTIVLSFAFYIPVVLWADVIPMIGMLMIPKTCAYVLTVVIGYNAMKKEIAW